MIEISSIGKNVAGVALTVLFLSLSGCGDESSELTSRRSYSLVWEDNFNDVAGTSPDATKWTYDIGTGSGGWGNNELQYYTDRTENVSMDGNGNLVMTALKESYGGKSYTSARIKTQGLFNQKYGRFEARLQTPYGKGLWPAFWMLGENITTVSWPQCGEIDIMELVGHKPLEIHGTVHGPGYSGSNGVGESFSQDGVRFDSEFHEFAIEWGENYIDYFVDDELYNSITTSDVNGDWVFNTDFFMILNVAVGGNWPGSPSSTTFFPQKMLVDYVRVYEEIQ